MKTEWKVEPGLASHEYLDLGLVRLEVLPSYVWLDNSPKSWRVELWAVNGGDELCIWEYERPTINDAKALGIASAKVILAETMKVLKNAR